MTDKTETDPAPLVHFPDVRLDLETNNQMSVSMFDPYLDQAIDTRSLPNLIDEHLAGFVGSITDDDWRERLFNHPAGAAARARARWIAAALEAEAARIKSLLTPEE